MADREDSVYQAKLAEQAERYDGKFKILVVLGDPASHPLPDPAFNGKITVLLIL